MEEYDICESKEENKIIIDTKESGCKDYSEDLSAHLKNDISDDINIDNTDDSFVDSIAIWAVKERIPLKSVSKLLKILKKTQMP